MKIFIASILSILVLATDLAQAATLAPGLYRDASGRSIYIGTENERPDPPANEYFDPESGRTGDISGTARVSLLRGINEERRVIHTPNGTLGVSVYYADTRRRAALILIHGNDPETREMGFIIPYFVLSGINVISYDQRGTGESSGNWQRSGPVQRAGDVGALYDAFAADPRVDGRRLGVWGFSNGGWTAPIVASQRPVAFMILKSAPAESVATNIDYEVMQRMRRRGFNAPALAAALHTWHALIAALEGKASWGAAHAQYAAASSQPWVDAAFIPRHLQWPLQAPVAQGLRNAVLYDPAATLRNVQAPTLALFGARDRNVDVAHASATLRSDFARAAMRDFTMHVYKDAGHTLKVSATGFNDQPSSPERFTAGYPQVMIQWLSRRGFLHGS